MPEQFSVECRKTKTKSFTTQPISNRQKTKTKTKVTAWLLQHSEIENCPDPSEPVPTTFSKDIV